MLHWGRDLGDLGEAELTALAHGQLQSLATNVVDDPVPLSIVPEASVGWPGTPGLRAHRQGRDFSTSFAVRRAQLSDDAGVQRLTVLATDDAARVDLAVELELHPSGVVRQRAVVTNPDPEVLDVEGLVTTLPVPSTARELLDLTGRHLRERTPQRHDFTHGTHLRENRRGRTGADASLLYLAGEPGFGFRSGQVWGVHVGWSGNHQVFGEAMPEGTRHLGGGEILLSGEVRLDRGESYASPWLYAAHGDGIDELSARFHSHLRARAHHPSRPRPVTLNTWEAVYFQHDLPRLRELADRAAAVGIERFVLDDGWFRGRNDDRAGLGDWYVDPAKWPDGLHPLVDHVRGLGMEFGLWVEPEMVNPDSDLAREHPDWILHAGDRMPPLARHQQVLDLGNPAAYAHIRERLDSVLSEYDIAYLKWDHNRDLVDPGNAHHRAGVHEQTLATYRLMDDLRAAHPGLEIESCSSGGGRVDLGVLEHTDRVWASDCIDPLERQQIQRWTGVLLPPELIGSHVGSPTSHTTGRTHPLDFRAGTAFFGHLGVEWDLAQAGEADLALLARWIEAHRSLRELLHTGTVVRADHPDPAVWVHGVVAADGSQAVHAVVQLATSVQSPPGPVRLPGLLPDASYDVRPLPPGDRTPGPSLSPLPWWAGGLTLSGRTLAEVGVQAPLLYPERMVLLRSRRRH